MKKFIIVLTAGLLIISFAQTQTLKQLDFQSNSASRKALTDTTAAVEARLQQDISDSLFLALLKTAFPDSANAWYARTLSIMRASAFPDSFIRAWNDSILAAEARAAITYLTKSAAPDSVVDALKRNPADSTQVQGVSGGDLVNPFRYLYKSYWSDRMTVGSQAASNSMLEVNTANTDTTRYVFGLRRNNTWLALMDSSGHWGFGMTPSANFPFQLRGTTSGSNPSQQQQVMSLYSTDSYSAGVGAGIIFGGKYNAGATPYIGFGHIAGVKENATLNNQAGKIIFGTNQASGTGGLDWTRMVIGSTGKVSMGGNFDATAGLTIKGVAANGDSLQNWRDSTGRTKAYIDSLGKFTGFLAFLDSLKLSATTALSAPSANVIAAAPSDTIRADAFQGGATLWDTPIERFTLIVTDSTSAGVGIDSTMTRTMWTQYFSWDSEDSPSLKTGIYGLTFLPVTLTPDSIMTDLYFTGTEADADSGAIMIVVKNQTGTIYSSGWVTVTTASTWEHWAAVIESPWMLRDKYYQVTVYMKSVSGGRWCFSPIRFR